MGLALVLPLTTPPVLAQVTPVAEVEEVEVNIAQLDSLEVEAPRVLISEVLIEGIGGHPEEERLQVAAYGAMQVRPGSRVTREELQRDLNAIQTTGWFYNVRINPVNGPLGVQVVVQVEPFPTLSRVELDPVSDELPDEVVDEIFSPDYGRTLNLNDLQKRMKDLQAWYAGQGYSLARISGPERVSPEGVVTLKLIRAALPALRCSSSISEGMPLMRTVIRFAARPRNGWSPVRSPFSPVTRSTATSSKRTSSASTAPSCSVM
jgi:outer membrane protein insertion porin family